MRNSVFWESVAWVSLIAILSLGMFVLIEAFKPEFDPPVSDTGQEHHQMLADTNSVDIYWTEYSDGMAESQPIELSMPSTRYDFNRVVEIGLKRWLPDRHTHENWTATNMVVRIKAPIDDRWWSNGVLHLTFKEMEGL